MYDAVNDRIREHDQTHLIFFESVTWEIAGIGRYFFGKLFSIIFEYKVVIVVFLSVCMADLKLGTN